MVLREISPIKREFRTDEQIKKEVITKLHNEYGGHITTNIKIEPKIIPFSKEQLINNIIESKTKFKDETQYGLDQLNILTQFIHLEDIAKDLGQIAQTVNTTTKFEGTYFSIKERVKRYNNLKNLRYITNAEQLLDGFNGTIRNVINFSEKVFSSKNLLAYDMPIWKNISEEIEELSIEGMKKINLVDERFFKSLRREFTSFVATYLGTTLYRNKRDDENIFDFHRRLLIGEESVAVRLRNFIEGVEEFEGIDEGKNSILNSVVVTEIAALKGEIDIIVLNNNKVEPGLMDRVTGTIIKMLNSDNQVVRELGEDLIAYTYITTGGNKTQSGLADVISTEYLKTGFGQFFNSSAEDGFINISRSKEVSKEFVEQLFRKNPRYGQKVGQKRLRKIEGHLGVRLLKLKNEELAAKYIYSISYDKKSKEYNTELYKFYTLSPDNSIVEYHQISLLQTYDANNINPKSIIESDNVRPVIPFYIKSNIELVGRTIPEIISEIIPEEKREEFFQLEAEIKESP
ncbi:MAG: hypothetical protein AABY07_07220, partial [Nanoarchaeota archaeon]